MEQLGLSEAAATWLEDKRAIPSEVAMRLGIVSSGRDLVFEYLMAGEVKYRKHRVTQLVNGVWTKTYKRTPAGVPDQLLWNEDSLSEEYGPNVPLVITEGEIDAASMVVAGAPAAVSVPNGAAGKPGQGDIIPEQDRQFAYLWHGGKLKANIDKFAKIIIATDDDDPGLILRDELALRLTRERCYFVTYPPGCKDANEVLVKYGPDGLTDMLAEAKPLVRDRLVQFSDIPPRAELKRYSSGWPKLDKHLMIVPPELVVVLGPAGVGKSQWSLALVANLARVHGLKGAILQFEDNPDRNRRDLLCYAEQHQIPTPPLWIDQMFRTISPSEDIEGDDYTLAWVHKVIEEAVVRHGCKWILIDPWNEIEHVWGVSESETAYTNSALRHIKKIARRFQIAIIIVTHPPKSAATGKTLEEMSLYDVAGSAAWKNKADHGIIVYRSDPAALDTFIKVDKSKDFHVMGMPGTVCMRYVRARATFDEV